MSTDTGATSKTFLEEIIERDLAANTHGGRVVTRFPPEPNGYLHIGHAKAICIAFGMASKYSGVCHLRFDDTNPSTEETEYVDGIMNDVRWLGFDWGDKLFFASDFFEEMYLLAEGLIADGKAYICELTEDEFRTAKGTINEPGTGSVYRDRPREESMDLFRRMRAGEFPNGAMVLRAKIDMSAPNMKLRDPPLYRIRHDRHHRTGDDWCIYPMYDYAHPLEDALEDVTHSICTLEFENNRAIYDWVVDETAVTTKPRQYEFARLGLDYTMMSKRKLRELVMEGHVRGWDDPRMPTLAGLRRRGVTPEAIRDFCEMIGVAKANSTVDIGKLDYTVRNDLNHRSPRVMCVLRPLKIVIENYPEDTVEWLDASYWPHDVPNEGSRKVPFTREIYIERSDFKENPGRKFYRLGPGREVRLRYGYYVTCTDVIKDASDEIVELRCSYDPATRGGSAPDGRKVKGTLHWVSATRSLPAEVRLYDRLFSTPDPYEGVEDFRDNLNPDSLIVLSGARVEPSVAEDAPETRYQFERTGYFWRDSVDSGPDALVFNRIVSLKDSWARSTKKVSAPSPRKERPRPSAPAARKDPYAGLDAEGIALARGWVDAHGISEDAAGVIAGDTNLTGFFEGGLDNSGDANGLANWVTNELARVLKEHESVPFDGPALGALVALVHEGAISGRIAKTVFAEMLTSGGDPAAIVETQDLRIIGDDDALRPIIDALIADNAGKVAAYRGGRTKLLGFFVGGVMRATRGKADPGAVNRLLREMLG